VRHHAARLRRLLRRQHSHERELPPELVTITPEDRRYLLNLYDDSVPLPEGAESELKPDNPGLQELRQAYWAVDLPVRSASRWNEEAVKSFLDLRWFRGESLIYWHYRELPRITELKYFAWLRYIQDRDEFGLLGRLEEDGSFGCWTFSYPGYGRFSRDLLESVNELLFLERELAFGRGAPFSVVDIGAGYGRLAHRMAEAYPHLADYCCVDAVPESTFVCDYHLRHRGCVPPTRVVRLDRLDEELEPGSFDLAVNIHSWSECTFEAVGAWVRLLERLRVEKLFVVPNEPTELLTLEPDLSRRDFMPLLERAGYRLVRREPVIEDPAVRELLRLHDHFHLFAREG
jgi:SAM-dependent methyltransferase